MTTKPTTKYDDSQIKVLKGVEAIQRRPGMYTDLDSTNHMVGEVVDNAQDEALAGAADRIEVELFEDGAVSVEDNGRGIPTGFNKEEGMTTPEVIFTITHAGGKFGEAGDRGAYGASGGLHGVGVTMTNALSTRVEVTIWREGWEHALAFEMGKVVEPMKKKKSADPDKHGTRVKVWPNAKYFNGGFQVARFEHGLRAKAVLMPGVEVIWKRPDRDAVVWKFEKDLGKFLTEELGEESLPVAPIFQLHKEYEQDELPFLKHEGFTLALVFQEQGKALRQSYVNLIPTKDGGQHEAGLKAGMYGAIKGVLDHYNLVPAKIKVEPEDVWARVAFVLSVKLIDPTFQNQTKDKMTLPRGKALVEKLVRDNLELWLHDNPAHAKAIGELVVSEAQRRQKSNVPIERRAGNAAAVLPGKLTDCLSNDPSICELFLVEGDSAGGSTKEGRDRNRQAVLPLKGKIFNCWEVDTGEMMSHDEPRAIAIAIGVEPHMGKMASEVDLSKLRYHKIIILSDADDDGLHIQTLLSGFFLRHYPVLVEKGHILVAQPPLYRVDAPAKKGSKEKEEKIYVQDNATLDRTIAALEKRGVPRHKIIIQRFKGLGEMNAEELCETTLDENQRKTFTLTVDNPAKAAEAFDLMLGKKQIEGRRSWMELEGNTVNSD